MRKPRLITINSTDFWIKVTGMLSQNYALVDKQDNGKFKIFFIGETSWVFDEIEFDSESEAVDGLVRNGFGRYSDNEDLHEFICLPESPFRQVEYMNEPIYSSGKYWK